jgi:GMP synthase (glutamine-hydrolysing)
MKIAAFQHVENETMGILETVCSKRGVPFEYIRLFEIGELPPIDATHLVFLGGPMSVNEEREYPFLAEEKALIRNAVGRGTPVLGICLGAQLIASAHGARVFPSTPEFGWCSVRVAAKGPNAVFPEHIRVFQLHGETFDIPTGGALLCTGDAVRNQAFRYGSAIGLQFHLEMTGEMIEDWTAECSSEEREKIRRDTALYLHESNRLCRDLASSFLKGWYPA